jgi:transcriptional regulator with XRE-family HTH domain
MSTQLIALLIKKRLDVLRMNRKEFADLIGTTPSQITKWLKGDHNFEVSTLFKIETALKMKIFSFTDQPESYCFPCALPKALTEPVNPETSNTNINK